MDKLTTTAFESIKSLWVEFFKFKKYKRLPIGVSIFLAILMFPGFLSALGLTLFYLFYYFIISVFLTPIQLLHNLVRDEGKQVHFLAQFVIYMTCFPLVFFLYCLTALLVPVMFMTYFAISVVTYIVSFGGMKFNAFFNKDVDREITPSSPRLPRYQWVPYSVMVIFLTFMAIVGLLCYIADAYKAGMWITYIFDSLLAIHLLFGWAFLWNKPKQKSNTPTPKYVEPMKEEAKTTYSQKIEEVKQEPQKEDPRPSIVKEEPKVEKAPKVRRKIFSKLQVFEIVLLGVSLLFYVIGTVFYSSANTYSTSSGWSSRTYNSHMSSYGPTLIPFLIFEIVAVCGYFGLLIPQKTRRLRFIASLVATLSSLLAFIFCIVSAANFTNKNTYWEISGAGIAVFVFFAIALGGALVSLIISLKHKD